MSLEERTVTGLVAGSRITASTTTGSGALIVASSITRAQTTSKQLCDHVDVQDPVVIGVPSMRVQRLALGRVRSG
jgi:phosphohistidine phosphatase SixA